MKRYSERKKKWTVIFRRVAFTVLVSMLASQAIGQTTTGSIYGTVSDQSGGVIPKASVTVTNTQTGAVHTAKSNSSGDYIFPALEPSDYTVSAQVTGFGTETQSGIRLDANQNAHVSFLLHPGSVDQTVTVSSATTLVDTRESQLGETVDQKRIEDLPLNGRNAYDLVQLVPGVTNYKQPAANGDQAGVKFSVNGERGNQNSFYLDGAVNTAVFSTGGNLIPNPDALQEFRLLTSNFDAEYGRAPGGVLNIISRSGTKAYHGLLYEYLRNDVLNAQNYFSTTGVTPLKQNQFGANFGGPIARDKAFFFLSYQGLRIATPSIINSGGITTLTAAEGRGDFRGDVGKANVKLPNVSCNGVKYVICPGLLDPVAQNALKFVPLADPVTGMSPQQSAPANTVADQGLARVDYQLTKSHQLSGTFFTSHGTNSNPGQGGNRIYSYSGLSSYANQTNAIVSDTWIISPNALNNLRLYYTLNHFDGSNTHSGPTLSDLGSKAAIGSDPATQPQFMITGYWTMGMGSGGVDNQYQQSFGAADTFNLTRGNHTVKLGGSYTWNKYAENGAYLGSSTSTFSGSTTGNALADFLEGKAASFRQNNGANHRLYEPAPALFAQDDWRITHKLTLDLGLRWEVFAPFVGQSNFGTFSPNVQSTRFPTAPLGLLSVGDPGVPDGVMHTLWKAFAPRVGFAYDVFGNGLTGLRGGYGIFYAARSLAQITNLEQQPFILDITVNGTPNLVTPYGSGADPFPYAPSSQNPVFHSGATISGVPPDAGFPYVQEYNLTLEQQLSAEWGARIAYVGSVGRKFYIARDENSPVYVPGACASCPGLNLRRPYQPTPSTYVFGEISQNDPAGNTSYNSLQVTLTRRLARGFSLLASYVWSKSIDISSADPANVALTLVDENNPARDRGPSDFDVPQRFVAAYLWSVPGINRWGFLGRQILSGWQLNGITTLSTGSPFNVTSGVDSNLDGTVNDRPNVIGDPRLSRSRSRAEKIRQFFNTAAFTPVPAGIPYGNTSRNLLFAPGLATTDFSAFKTFQMRELGAIQFRGELFNLFNNVNLGTPNAVQSSKLFGQIHAAGPARVVQFALRYTF